MVVPRELEARALIVTVGKRREAQAMKRHVLVTLDGSPLSEAVLPVVADQFGGEETVVTLLAVAEVPSATADSPRNSVQPFVYLGSSRPAVRQASEKRYAETKGQALERTQDELMGYLEGKARALRKRGIEVHTAVEFGDPKEVIAEFAGRKGVDLVAMATHGHTGLSALIFGSVAGRVVYSGARPVLLVRPSDAAKGWQEETSGAKDKRTP
jgi:nucleotide-binding universal stress UspA family protein